MNTKLHALCDSQGRPLNLFVTASQVSDDIGARAVLSSLPDVDWLLGLSWDISCGITLSGS
jgi:transposase